MKTLMRVTGLLVSTAVVLPAMADTPGVTDDVIKIGTFGPITGPHYALGRLPMNGLETVIDDVNAAGGIHGRRLQLVRVDDQCDPAGAIAAVRRLVFNEQVFAIVGGSCSNGVLAAKEDIEEAGIPYVNFTAASNLISAPKVDNIFTSMLTSNLEGQLQAQYLADKGVTKAAVVAQHDAWGRDRYDGLLPALEARGIELVADEELSMESNDATAQVLRVQSSGAEAVVLLTYPKPASIFLRDSARLGFDATFLGTTVIPDPVAFDELVAIPGATKNFVTISPSRYPIDSEEAGEWREKLIAKFPDDTPHSYNLFGITAGQLAVAVLEEVGSDLTREAFINVLSSTKSLEVTFAPAPLNCDTHQCLQSAAWYRRTDDGKTETVGITELK
ncbi:ABC transporter substrate-binding protein [Neoaquamicrobium sediminum]|uniref:ABC transporter substrate-binding protein n=1 Tax=Neoaquamicrobium sediminum TaxID=1849104 RepID=UPI0015645689|nr:ABC transporter substrate-binding protein [Mesorhizobium sediminum]NRC57240.1 ABC transporter substrate-binding protein [Mesorhizobium sediminum]